MKGLAHRVSWGFFDQVLSSATNFVLGLVVAATVSATQFGAFSLVYAGYGFCLGLSEGITSTPLIVRFSAAAGSELRAAELDSVGASFVVGVAGGVVCLILASFLGPTVGPSLRALGVMLPGLLVQDGWRYAFMARGRPAMAAANDGVWAGLQVIGIAGLLVAHAVSATSMVLVWGGAATGAALFGCTQVGAWPAAGRWWDWFRQQRDLGPRYAIESVAHRSGTWLAIVAVGSIAGLRAVAALRGAILVVSGPLNLLFVGAGFVAVPEGVRLFNQAPGRLPHATRVFSLAVTVLTAAWCAVVLAGSARLGPHVLGSTWPLAKPLLPIFILQALALAVSIGPGQAMWALGAARRSLRTQLASVVLSVAATSAGAVADGSHGAAAGLVGATVITTVIWWWQFRQAFADATVTVA